MKSRGLVRGTACAVLLMVLAAAFGGCGLFKSKPPAPPPPAPPPVPAAPVPPPEPKYFVHVVKYWGESVSIIAGWYTGDINNWEAVAAANPDINPNRIVQGNRIRIPENLMIKSDPMPKDYVDSFYPKPPQKAKPAAPAAPAEEEPQLFGPKK